MLLTGEVEISDTFMGGKYDLAIVVLTQLINYRPGIAKVELPNPNDDCAKFGKTMIIAGWGLDISTNTRHDKLWRVAQECIPMERCNHRDDVLGWDMTICVGDETKMENTPCWGDSGGNQIFLEG